MPAESRDLTRILTDKTDGDDTIAVKFFRVHYLEGTVRNEFNFRDVFF